MSATMPSQGTRDERFDQMAAHLGHEFAGEIKIGGNYTALVHDGDIAYVSGQIPRVGDQVVVTGRAGKTVELDEARLAASICAMRALALLRQHLGTLTRVRHLLRITVYVQCDAAFTLHSEVADGASEVLHHVLGEAGKHTRTSVGAYALPKGATVELDMIAKVEAGE